MLNIQTLEKLAEVFNLEAKDLFDFSNEISLNTHTAERKNYLISRLDDIGEKEIEFIISFLDHLKLLR